MTQSYDTVVFAIVFCRLGRTKLLNSHGDPLKHNLTQSKRDSTLTLLASTSICQRLDARSQKSVQGTTSSKPLPAPSVTQRCWQSLADAAWNYPHTSNSPKIISHEDCTHTSVTFGCNDSWSSWSPANSHPPAAQFSKQAHLI